MWDSPLRNECDSLKYSETTLILFDLTETKPPILLRLQHKETSAQRPCVTLDYLKGMCPYQPYAHKRSKQTPLVH